VYPPDRDDHARQSAVQAATARRRVTFSSRQEALANFAGKPPLDSISADSLAAYVDDGFAPAGDGSVSLRCPPAVEAEVYRTSPLSSVDARLVDVACPVIVASGEGPPGLATDAARIVSRLARGRHLPMSGLGHLGPFQDPPAVARAVVEALVG
jgi:pimeloyl-ACP methyl ester carboxylesterase